MFRCLPRRMGTAPVERAHRMREHESTLHCIPIPRLPTCKYWKNLKVTHSIRLVDIVIFFVFVFFQRINAYPVFAQLSLNFPFKFVSFLGTKRNVFIRTVFQPIFYSAPTSTVMVSDLAMTGMTLTTWCRRCNTSRSNCRSLCTVEISCSNVQCQSVH